MTRAFLPLALLLLPACHQASDDPRVVTPEEDAALNHAAASLEANTTEAPPR